MSYELFPENIPDELIELFEDDLEMIQDVLDECPLSWMAVASHSDYSVMRAIRDAFWLDRPDMGLSVYRREIVFDPDSKKWILFAKAMKAQDEDAVAKDAATENELLLCNTIAELAQANGYKVHNAVTKSNIKWARLCFKRAAELEKSEESVIKLAKWAMTDPFWMQNIRSVSKFYKQYDRLREQANREFNSAASKVWNKDTGAAPKTASAWDKVS